MRKKFSVRRFIFIADRGLFSVANLDHIRNNHGEFINEELAIWETQYGEDRGIVTWSKTRDDILANIREKLSKKSSRTKSFVIVSLVLSPM